MNVKVIQHQNNESEYTYIVPGTFNATSTTNSGTTTTNGTYTAPTEYSYTVIGATFSLLLPDGRVAVVNCASKYKFRGERSINMRSCRRPLVDDIQVEFKGKNAKLMWLASIDGKKFDSETYKILAVLSK